MNARFLLLVVGVAALSSCSSVYKTGQTPDDVYYSPAPPQEEYVQVQKNQDRYQDRYQTYEEYQDNYRNDRFLRMSIGNPYYMNAYNMYGGFDWRYNSLAYDFYNPWNPWNSYWYWNSFYNPYCSLGYGYRYGIPVGYNYYKQPLYTQYVNPVSRPLSFNPSSYSGNGRTIYSRGGTPANNSYYRSGNYNTPRYNNSNYSQRLFNNGHNDNSYSPSNNNTYTPSRSYTPSSSSSSSSSSGSSSSGSRSSSSSSGSVSRPGRGN